MRKPVLIYQPHILPYKKLALLCPSAQTLYIYQLVFFKMLMITSNCLNQ